MEKKEYVHLGSNHSTETQKKYPSAIPVIGKITELDGKLFAEVLEYRDQFGNKLYLDKDDSSIYH